MKTCPTGKRCFTSKSAARKATARSDARLRPYWCFDHCRMWHVTNPERFVPAPDHGQPRRKVRSRRKMELAPPMTLEELERRAAEKRAAACRVGVIVAALVLQACVSAGGATCFVPEEPARQEDR